MDNITHQHNTQAEFAEQIGRCRAIFEAKTRDYGTSWRILRLPSLTDQIFIKARRLRSIQTNGVMLVDEAPDDPFRSMVNYGVMALIQAHCDDTTPIDLPLNKALDLYDSHIASATALMNNKNHDYDEAWRQMRISSMVDIILMKLHRIKQIEDNQGKTIASEGVEGNYMDIINYSLFCLILLNEQNKQNQ